MSESERNNNINYLDIYIPRSELNFVFHIHQKPTFSDTIVPYDSCHPEQHKYAVVRFLYNRLHTYNLDETAKSQDLNTIHDTLYNAFPIRTYVCQKDSDLSTLNTQKQKWAIFTYVGNDTKFITHLFNNTNIKIAYRTNNSTGSSLKLKHSKFDKYSASGVFKLSCPNWNKAYSGCPLEPITYLPILSNIYWKIPTA
jgi:hypothetical protein